MLALLSFFEGSQAACMSRFTDGAATVIYSPLDDDQRAQPAWSWHFDLPDGSTELVSRRQPTTVPEFSSSGETWSTSLSQCDTDWAATTFTVTFERPGASIFDIDLSAIQIQQQGLEFSSSENKIQWLPDAKQLGKEHFGPWLVKIHSSKTTLLEFTLQMAAPCQYQAGQPALNERPLALPSKRAYVWARLPQHQGLTSTSHALTDSDCEKMAASEVTKVALMSPSVGNLIDYGLTWTFETPNLITVSITDSSLLDSVLGNLTHERLSVSIFEYHGDVPFYRGEGLLEVVNCANTFELDLLTAPEMLPPQNPGTETSSFSLVTFDLFYDREFAYSISKRAKFGLSPKTASTDQVLSRICADSSDFLDLQIKCKATIDPTVDDPDAFETTKFLPSDSHAQKSTAFMVEAGVYSSTDTCHLTTHSIRGSSTTPQRHLQEWSQEEPMRGDALQNKRVLPAGLLSTDAGIIYEWTYVYDGADTGFDFESGSTITAKGIESSQTIDAANSPTEAILRVQHASIDDLTFSHPYTPPYTKQCSVFLDTELRCTFKAQHVQFPSTELPATVPQTTILEYKIDFSTLQSGSVNTDMTWTIELKDSSDTLVDNLTFSIFISTDQELVYSVKRNELIWAANDISSFINYYGMTIPKDVVLPYVLYGFPDSYTNKVHAVWKDDYDANSGGLYQPVAGTAYASTGYISDNEIGAAQGPTEFVFTVQGDTNYGQKVIVTSVANYNSADRAKWQSIGKMIVHLILDQSNIVVGFKAWETLIKDPCPAAENVFTVAGPSERAFTSTNLGPLSLFTSLTYSFPDLGAYFGTNQYDVQTQDSTGICNLDFAITDVVANSANPTTAFTVSSCANLDDPCTVTLPNADQVPDTSNGEEVTKFLVDVTFTSNNSAQRGDISPYTAEFYLGECDYSLTVNPAYTFESGDIKFFSEFQPKLVWPPDTIIAGQGAPCTGTILELYGAERDFSSASGIVTATYGIRWTLGDFEIEKELNPQDFIISLIFTSEFVELEITPANDSIGVFEMVQEKLDTSSDKTFSLDFTEYIIAYKYHSEVRPFSPDVFTTTDASINPDDYMVIQSSATSPNVGDTVDPAYLAGSFEEVYTSGWTSWLDNAVSITCSAWSQDNAGSTVTGLISVRNSQETRITQDFDYSCVYTQCSNRQAVDNLEDTDAQVGQIVHLDTLVHLVHVEKQEILLSHVSIWCQNHTQLQKIQSVLALYPDGSSKALTSESEFLAHGLSIDSVKEGMALIVEADDDTLYGAIFDIEVLAYVEEEPDWSNLTRIRVVYEKPSCQLEAREIQSQMNAVPTIDLRAIKVIETDTFDISEVIEMANSAFAIGEQTFCGPIEYELVPDVVNEDHPFITLEEGSSLIMLAPQFSDQPELYRDFLRFYFVDWPDREAYVLVQSEIQECGLNSLKYTKKLLTKSYKLGDAASQIDLPELTYSPDCGSTPEPSIRYVVTSNVPDGISEELVKIENGSAVLLRSTDLALYKQTVEFELVSEYQGVPDFSVIISVSYDADGPSFDMVANGEAPPITCSQADAYWAYTLPELVGGSQQSSTISHVITSEFSKMFDFDAETRLLTIQEKFKEQLVVGKLCPQGTNELTFELKSDILGTSLRQIQIKTEAASDDVQFFDFKNGSLESAVESLEIAQLSLVELEKLAKSKVLSKKVNGHQLPEARLKPTKSDGSLEITMTNEMTWPANFMETINLNLQKSRKLQKQGSRMAQTRARNLIDIAFYDSETELESDNLVGWSVSSVEPSSIKIKLEFKDPLLVSQGRNPDKIIVQLRLEEFKDVYGNSPESPQIKVREMVRQLGSDAETIETTGQVAQAVTGTVTGSSFLVNLLLNTSLSQIWSMLNNAQNIVFMPMFEYLKFPANAFKINAFLINIATFDLINTGDWIDPLFYEIPEGDPFTINFEECGYESQLALGNISVIVWTYKLHIIIFLFAFLPALWLGKCSQTAARLANWLSSYFFWSGLIRLLMETFLDSFFAAALNWHTIDWDTEYVYVTYSNYLSIALVVILTICTILLFIFYCQNFDVLKDPEMNEKYGAAFEGTDQDKIINPRSIFGFLAIFFIRRLLFVYSVIYLGQSLWLQLLGQTYTSLIVIIYLVQYKPLDSPFANRIELMNEVTVLLVTYLLTCFTDYIQEPVHRYRIGYVYIVVVMANIVVHLFIIGVSMLINLKLKCRGQLVLPNRESIEMRMIKRRTATGVLALRQQMPKESLMRLKRRQRKAAPPLQVINEEIGEAEEDEMMLLAGQSESRQQQGNPLIHMISTTGQPIQHPKFKHVHFSADFPTSVLDGIDVDKLIEELQGESDDDYKQDSWRSDEEIKEERKVTDDDNAFDNLVDQILAENVPYGKQHAQLQTFTEQKTKPKRRPAKVSSKKKKSHLIQAKFNKK